MTASVAVTDDVAPQIAAFTRVACPYDLLRRGPSSARSSTIRPIRTSRSPSTTADSRRSGRRSSAASQRVREVPRRPSARAAPRHRDEPARPARGRSAASTAPRRWTSATRPPSIVVPGVDVRATEAICFFAAARLRARRRRREPGASGSPTCPEPELPCHVATTDDLAAAHAVGDASITRTGSRSSLAAVELGTCVVHDDLGFACYDVNRDGWFGPMATRPDMRTQRASGPQRFSRSLHRMRALGYEHADIAWSGPLLFYLKVGGRDGSRASSGGSGRSFRGSASTAGDRFAQPLQRLRQQTRHVHL